MSVARWKNRAKLSLLAVEGMNMKSSPKVHPQTSQVQFQAWNPAELGVEFAASPAETQMEQVLAIFHDEARDSGTQSDSRSALYSRGTGQNFSTWQPGEMDSKPTGVRKADWTFFGSAEAPYQETQQPPRFEFEVLVGTTPQDQQDREALMVLEQARIQAEEIILAAQAEADNVLLQAQEEIDEQKKEAYQQGRNQAISEFGDALKATHTMVEEVHAWKTELISQGERILVDMLVEIAQKMFGEGVELNPEALQINLNRVLENAYGLGDLNIFLNPRDAKTLDPSWSEYQMLVSGDRVKIIPSGKITRGGCFIKGIMGSVDGRVETQLSAILKTFEDDSELAE
jgi:flagellar assembly protein FliH